MDHGVLVGTLLALAAFFTLIALLTRGRRPQSVPEYFIASRSLRPSFVTSMLLSGSFSLNGMLYQIFLGYNIGWWALLPQGFWALSFILLAKFADRISASAGLHSFLGTVFSPRTRTLAAICSVIGLSLQIGWEYSVARSAFSGLTDPALSELANYMVVGAMFGAATIYTMIGGLRSNSFTNLLQNGLKIGCFVILGFLVYGAANVDEGTARWGIMPPDTMILQFTIVGLIANLAFSLAWQFGEMSTWQTAIAAKDGGPGKNARSALKWAGMWVFIAPGILGTVIGIVMSGQAGLDSNSILPALLDAMNSHPIVTALLAVALVAAVMSFVDGIVLAIGYTAVTDLLFRKTVDEYQLLREPTPDEAQRPGYQRAFATVMASSRVTLLAALISGTVFLDFLSRQGVSLFEQVYVVTVAQLSLVGVTVQGLRGWIAKPHAGVQSISAGLVLGFGFVAAGVWFERADIGTLAPVGALVGSWGVARLRTRPPALTPVPASQSVGASS